MAEEALREILDAMRQRIEAELDARIQALTAQHDEALARVRQETEARVRQETEARVQEETEARVRQETETRVRQDTEAEVEKRWASKVDAVRAEWAARLQSEVSAARADAENRLVSESMLVRTEAEQNLAAERRRAEQELQRTLAALDAERQRAASQLDAERRRGSEELQRTLAAFDSERQRLEQQAQSRQSPDVDPATVLAATRAIGDARSLSDALASLVRGAAAHAPRVALFIVNGTHLDEWSVAGVPPMSHEPMHLEQGGLLHAAVSRGGIVSAISGDADNAPPGFASLSPGRQAMATPLIVGGHAVAVLYADEGASGAGTRNQAWRDAVELLGRHAGACLAHLTAMRSLQVLQGGNGHADVGDVPQQPDDERSARRYAKLLVSEIKLYNEGAVRIGCEKRDLLHRLRAEIDRARRLYEERVPSSVTTRTAYFQQELVHTLAGGDPALLGS
jgi:hypothetical protein